MLKIAVIGAQTMLGRELVASLEPQDCSVLPLSTGALSKTEEEGDIVVFAPDPSLLEGLDVVILTDTPENPELLQAFPGRILDLRDEPQLTNSEPMPLAGTWPTGAKRIHGRPALDLVLAILPSIVSGFGDLSGTHLRSVAMLGDKGIDGLVDQTMSILKGEDPSLELLGYRQAFETIPQAARGSLIEVRMPVFHGDLLVLHLRAAVGDKLLKRPAATGMQWTELPPTSREVAVSSNLLMHLNLDAEAQKGTLVLGFDPILWGVIRPTLRLLGLLEG